MIEAYGQFYEAEMEAFIKSLSRLFNFQKFEIRGDEAWLCCPFHAHGQERTASASFHLTGKDAGKFFCFGCKTKGRLSSILTKLFGSKAKVINYLNSNYTRLHVEKAREVNKVETRASQLTQEFDLPESLFTNKTDYYESRGIPDELVERFKLGYSKRRNAIIFPVYEDGKIVFYQIRYLDKDSKLKWYIPKDAKVKIWGKESITDRRVIVCESVFNALTCWKFGKQAVATFGARCDDETLEDLLSIGCLSYTIAFDGDEAGRKSALELSKKLRSRNRLVRILRVPDKTDINNFAKVTKEKFDQLWQEWQK